MVLLPSNNRLSIVISHVYVRKAVRVPFESQIDHYAEVTASACLRRRSIVSNKIDDLPGPCVFGPIGTAIYFPI